MRNSNFDRLISAQKSADKEFVIGNNRAEAGFA